uniref:Odorant binding protein 9 n=1 Tax=Pachypeltis micranthus TaxID=1983339 RepID=A0A1W6QYG7_9HEMI|nr:odorant binding protein 9 [Pachypeltis micranthus]
MFLKRFLVLAVAVAAMLPTSEAYMSQAQVKQALKTLRNMCLPKTGVDKEALNKMVDEGVFDETNDKLKCYLGCILGMMQAVKDNKISLTMVRNQVSKMLAPEQGQRIVVTFESCSGVTGTDKCDLAFNFAKCVYETDKEAFIVP